MISGEITVVYTPSEFSALPSHFRIHRSIYLLDSNDTIASCNQWQPLDAFSIERLGGVSSPLEKHSQVLWDTLVNIEMMRLSYQIR